MLFIGVYYMWGNIFLLYVGGIRHMDMFILNPQQLISAGISYLGTDYKYFFLSGKPDELNTIQRFLSGALSFRRFEDKVYFYGNSSELSDFLSRPTDNLELNTLKTKITSYLEVNIDSISLPGSRKLSLDKPLIMGVINATEDSFFSESRVIDEEVFFSKVSEMVTMGVDIIDIGGESSRPGSLPVSSEEEIKRIVPLIKRLRKSFDIPISVDTYRMETAKAAFNAGADIINDISGLQFDTAMASFAAETKMPVVIMHIKGKPETMQQNPYYSDVLKEMKTYFEERIQYALKNGIKRENLILDPGIGFGKRLEDNLRILKNLDTLRVFGLPLLLGTSRKSFIGEVLKQKNPKDRLSGTLGTTALGVQKGVKIFRVHDVKENREIADLVFNIIK
jgi:dihydropteroate synthase